MHNIRIDGYSEQTQLEFIKLSISSKPSLAKEHPKYVKLKEKAAAFLAPYIPQDIMSTIDIISYQEEDYILHERVSGEVHYFFIVLEGACKITYDSKFLSYKREGEIIGSVSLALEEAPDTPSATVIAYTDELYLARLEITESIRKQLRENLPFMKWMADDLARTVLSNNAFSSLNTNLKQLAAYILCNVNGKDDVSYTPSKTAMKNTLNISDHSQLNKLIDALIEKGALSDITSSPKRGRSASTYLIHRNVLEDIINHIDYTLISDRFSPTVTE